MKADIEASLCEALDVRPGMLVALVGAGGKTSLMYGLGRELARQGRPALLTTTTKIRFPGKDQAGEVVLGEENGRTVEEIRSRFARGAVVVAGRGRIEEKIAGFGPHFVESLKCADPLWTVVAECDGALGKSLKVPREGEPPVAESTDVYVVVVGGDCFGVPVGSQEIFNPEMVAAVAEVNLSAVVDREVVVRVVASGRSYLGRRPPSAKCSVFINKIGVEGFERSGEDFEKGRVTEALETGLALREIDGIERVAMGSLERGSGKAFLVFK